MMSPATVYFAVVSCNPSVLEPKLSPWSQSLHRMASKAPYMLTFSTLAFLVLLYLGVTSPMIHAVMNVDGEGDSVKSRVYEEYPKMFPMVWPYWYAESQWDVTMSIFDCIRNIWHSDFELYGYKLQAFCGIMMFACSVFVPAADVVLGTMSALTQIRGNDETTEATQRSIWRARYVL